MCLDYEVHAFTLPAVVCITLDQELDEGQL